MKQPRSEEKKAFCPKYWAYLSNVKWTSWTQCVSTNCGIGITGCPLYGIKSDCWDKFDEQRNRKSKKPGKCETCETQLGIVGGMGGTELCGPCCTGESETLTEIGESW